MYDHINGTLYYFKIIHWSNNNPLYGNYYTTHNPASYLPTRQIFKSIYKNKCLLSISKNIYENSLAKINSKYFISC